MASDTGAHETGQIADAMLAALGACRQIAPVSDGDTGFDLHQAYRVTEAVRTRREARGERVVGRKIGFTNTTIWAEYRVFAPIWGYVYDTTLHKLADLAAPFDASALVEPRIEPEIIFGLGQAPDPGMDEKALLSCVEWAAHGFEIVQSLFPGWRFAAADTVAAFGLHGASLVSAPEPIGPGERERWHEALSSFRIVLKRNGEAVDQGRATNVLGGGPLTALRHLVEVLSKTPEALPLAAGDVVTTGTLTRAMPIAPGETWSTELVGVPLRGAALALA